MSRVSGDRRTRPISRAARSWSRRLLAADGDVYAVAQGALVTNAFAARGAAALGHAQRSDLRDISPTARRSSGRSVYTLADHPELHLSLRNPDLTTARRIEAAINHALTQGIARRDPTRGR